MRAGAQLHAESDCDRANSLVRVYAFDAGPLTSQELEAIRTCDVTLPTPVHTPTHALWMYVYEYRDPIEACVAAARSETPTIAPRLSIVAGRPAPHFARTGDADLDACLAAAMQSADPGYDSLDTADSYEFPIEIFETRAD